MSKLNSYFEVVEPFRVLVAVGSSPSNAYYGASRIYETRYEARNAPAGSTMHALVGGTFLHLPDGTMREVSLRAPSAPFERGHGSVATAAETLAAMEMSGRVREVGEPSVDMNRLYGSARALAGTPLPEHTGGVVVVDQNPDLAAFVSDMERLQMALVDDGGMVRFVEDPDGSSVTMEIRYADGPACARVRRHGRTGMTWAYGELPGTALMQDRFGALSGHGSEPRATFAARVEETVAGLELDEEAAGFGP